MNVISKTGSDRIHIIHVITRFDKGGSAENTFLTVRDLDKKRYAVRMVHGLSHESQMGEAERRAVERNLSEAYQNGVEITVLPELVRDIEPGKDLQALLRLVRIFRRARPDIVHTHTSKAGLIGRWAAFLARVPVIIHTPHGHVFWGYFKDKQTKLFILLEFITAWFTDRLIMLTRQEMEDHLRFRIAPRKKFTIIHSGVDFQTFQHRSVDQDLLRQKLHIPRDAFVIGSIGRLARVKGHRYLLEALALLTPRLENLVCVLLGDGELRSDLEDLSIRLGIRDRIFFLGWRADVGPIMSIFDIFAFPSLNEGMGKVLVEAMALGKPIIATAVGGIINLVSSGENGLLISPGDAENLAKSIELLYQNQCLRQNMGEKGKLTSAAYSSDLMIRKIEALYAELTAGCAPPRG